MADKIPAMEPLPPSPHVEVVSSTDSTALLIAVTRLEAKIDVALAQQRAKIDAHDSDLVDHEARIRAVEGRPSPAQELRDHEARLRAVEARPSVAPKALWLTVSSALGLALASYPFLDRLFN